MKFMHGIMYLKPIHIMNFIYYLVHIYGNFSQYLMYFVSGNTVSETQNSSFGLGKHVP